MLPALSELALVGASTEKNPRPTFLLEHADGRNMHIRSAEAAQNGFEYLVREVEKLHHTLLGLSHRLHTSCAEIRSKSVGLPEETEFHKYRVLMAKLAGTKDQWAAARVYAISNTLTLLHFCASVIRTRTSEIASAVQSGDEARAPELWRDLQSYAAKHTEFANNVLYHYKHNIIPKGKEFEEGVEEVSTVHSNLYKPHKTYTFYILVSRTHRVGTFWHSRHLAR